MRPVVIWLLSPFKRASPNPPYAKKVYDASPIVHDPSRYLIHLQAVTARTQDEAEKHLAALRAGQSFSDLAQQLAANAPKAATNGERSPADPAPVYGDAPRAAEHSDF